MTNLHFTHPVEMMSKNFECKYFDPDKSNSSSQIHQYTYHIFLKLGRIRNSMRDTCCLIHMHSLVWECSPSIKVGKTKEHAWLTFKWFNFNLAAYRYILNLNLKKLCHFYGFFIQSNSKIRTALRTIEIKLKFTLFNSLSLNVHSLSFILKIWENSNIKSLRRWFLNTVEKGKFLS